MPRVGAVDLVDDRSQCGRFTGARGACDENKPLVQMAKRTDRRWQFEVFERQDLFWNDPEDCARAVLLVEVVGAKAGEALQAVS